VSALYSIYIIYLFIYFIIIIYIIYILICIQFDNTLNFKTLRCDLDLPLGILGIFKTITNRSLRIRIKYEVLGLMYDNSNLFQFPVTPSNPGYETKDT
jgi:hypothetical protein